MIGRDLSGYSWVTRRSSAAAPGLNDILIAVVDGLKGFPEAIASVYPQTVVQTCIVHLIRNSLAFVAWKESQGDLACHQGNLPGRECRHGAGPARGVRG